MYPASRYAGALDCGDRCFGGEAADDQEQQEPMNTPRKALEIKPEIHPQDLPLPWPADDCVWEVSGVGTRIMAGPFEWLTPIAMIESNSGKQVLGFDVLSDRTVLNRGLILERISPKHLKTKPVHKSLRTNTI